MSEYIMEYLPDTTCIEREEVVRCRDCKHYKDRNGAILPSLVCQRLGYYNFKVEPDGFCAWGERRGA